MYRRRRSTRSLGIQRRARAKPRRAAQPRRLQWREGMVSSKLYGRSRYLHKVQEGRAVDE